VIAIEATRRLLGVAWIEAQTIAPKLVHTAVQAAVRR
jgi:hypothetical protein